MCERGCADGASPTGGTDPVPGAVKSDPHFSGLDGHAYDFMGEAGKVYAIIAYPSMQGDSFSVISRFGTAYTTGVSMNEGSLVAYKAKVPSFPISGRTSATGLLKP
eukprot:scaffold1065_cov406-Prasinococcus_capsulatus_cf.AAC.4